ncbi:MAG: acyltransferase family protein [Cyanobium sp.]
MSSCARLANRQQVPVDVAKITSHRSSSYRPEIDGLRAVAVVAVLIHHLHHQWLPGGFLGVDLFFVISGYVVTASLARREETNRQHMLAGFYTRRFRRLLPALLLMVVLTALLLGLFVSSADDQYALSMRTGLASLFGVSNLFLLRQGTNYFDLGTQFNPFLHTWSLGVEEQFYLIWPLLAIVCGVGLKGQKRKSLVRLLVCTLVLAAGSFVLFLNFSHGDQGAAAFYLMPARFWELAAGALVFLLQALRPQPEATAGRSARFSMANGLFFSLLLGGLLGSSDQAGRFRPLVVIATSGLLVSLHKHSGLGRWLSHPACLAVGVSSYSLYLWHWPLIVLLRWTFGLHAWTLIPLIVAIALCTGGSYWVETTFRFGEMRGEWQKWPLVLYPLTSILTASIVAGMWKFGGRQLFQGTPSHHPENFTVSRSIGGTTVTTFNCFVEPDSPLEASQDSHKCQTSSDPKLPTLYVEGDSIAHSLVPMLERLYQSKQFNISFFARGGCITPFVKPWPGNRHLLPRYRNCPQHAEIRQRIVLDNIKPGDQLVLATTHAYVQSTRSQSNYLDTISSLAKKLESKGAGLILFSPFPVFAERASITTPLSLCFQEWFRPAWAIPRDCLPAKADRRPLVETNRAILNLQGQLQQQHKNIRVFDPFPLFCPPGQDQCSTHLHGSMMFADGIHLTAAGGRFLYPAFQSFLNQTP